MNASQKLDALKKKFAHRDPIAAVYAGRVAIGFLFDHADSKRRAAVAAAHEWIGAPLDQGEGTSRCHAASC